ncbi:MAG: hypothetical protein JO157_00610 [Acetobacteraceae bacterium]|nr:hypothetical protein [Acetobacteraceae bacterium]
MRRTALLAPLLMSLSPLLTGCTGFGTFIDHTFRLPGQNPDLPQADSENVRRSLGRDAPVAPLSPEPGDVWPPPAPPAPTLGEVERSPELQNQFAPTTVPGERPGLPAGHEPVPTGRPTEPRPPLPKLLPQRRGSSTPPGSVEPGLEPALPPTPAPLPPPPRGPSGSPPPGGAVQLPGGVGVDTGGTSGYRQLTLPNGQPGAIVVPNGNGTSTVIGPDGSVTTIPTPRK